MKHARYPREGRKNKMWRLPREKRRCRTIKVEMRLKEKRMMMKMLGGNENDNRAEKRKTMMRKKIERSRREKTERCGWNKWRRGGERGG